MAMLSFEFNLYVTIRTPAGLFTNSAVRSIKSRINLVLLKVESANCDEDDASSERRRRLARTTAHGVDDQCSTGL
jgi:hypothetical protein